MSQPSVVGNHHVDISNTLATYCIALDSKNFELLRDVFAEDVDVKFPFSSPQGLPAVMAAIEKRLRPVTSQHALTTQLIKVASDGQSADVTTYFTGIHFGKGKWDGKDVTAWGQYVDHLIFDETRQTGGGSGNPWLIKKRTVTFFGRRGEEGVMDGE